MPEWVDKLRHQFESRTGQKVVPEERLNLLEADSQERRILQRELDLLGYNVLDLMSGSPQEVKATERRKMATEARVIWTRDAQAGAAVDLVNDFVWGRGAPRPKAKDPVVQEVLDEAWDDADNQTVLTSYSGQIALGTDLVLQSNIFVLIFDEGEDGRVKLGLLEHDAVENVVRHEDNRLRVLYYVARERKQEWSYETDAPKPKMESLDGDKPKVRYFAHHANVAELEDAGIKFSKPPKEKLGDGLVYHIAINRTSEMAFGVPTFRRIQKWIRAFDSFMAARVDLMNAAASLIMKRKITGTPEQVAKLAAKAISRRSNLAATDIDGTDFTVPNTPGGIINENQGVSHEAMSIPTNASNALTDAQMIRSQVSAATRFPASYYGDASASNLATATSLELPVLKKIEALQEVYEGLIRFFLDRVIEKAIESGRIPEEKDTPDQANTNLGEADEVNPEEDDDNKRDLSYDFSLPSPLRRQMTDLIASIQQIAQTFDPNGTNIELSRILLTIALGEGLEMSDPAEAVESVFPANYVDPALAAIQDQQGQSNIFAPQGQQPPLAPGMPPPHPGQMAMPVTTGPPQGEANPYSVAQRSRPPEVAMRQSAETEAEEQSTLDLLFQADVESIATEELAKLIHRPSSNGKF